MEDQLLQLLADTQSSAEGPRRQAEHQLDLLQTNEQYPMSLAAIASHASVPLNLRQSALFVLKNFVLASWSAQIDEKYTGAVVVPETTKEHLRRVLLELATSTDNDRKVQSAGLPNACQNQNQD